VIDSPFVLIGIGAAVSVLGFFIKRMKEEIDVLKSKNTRIEINQARNYEKIINLEKVTEDRREDIKNLFSALGK
jgi:Tfp pilus assembly protein PilO